MKFRPLDIVLLILLLAAVTCGMFWARASAFQVYGGQQSQTEWDAWREDAKELAKGTGPVARRAPQSVSPPALVLMRDYFVICLGLSLLLSGVLFLTMLAFIRGAFATPAFVDRSLPEEKSQSTDAPRH